MLDYNEDQFRDLFENSNDLIHFLTIDGHIQFVNNAWLKALEYRPFEVIGKSIYDFIHPDSVEQYFNYRKNIINKGRTWDIETSLWTKSGNRILIEGHIGCKYRDGSPLYTRGIFKNITQRKEAEEHFKIIFNNAPDAVIVIDENSSVLKWNNKAKIIFGYSENEMIGSCLTSKIIPENLREAHKRGMQHFLKTGEGPVLGKTIEIIAQHKLGHEFYINLSISAAKISEKWYFIAFASDITSRKETESALIKKEAELLHSKIQEVKKDEFISIASHELKTPLTTVKAYVELLNVSLTQDPDLSQLIKYVKKAEEGLGKLQSLIAELLDVSRIKSGKLQLNLNKFNFEELLFSSIENITHISPQHKIKRQGNANVEIMGDKDRIEQVLTNFFTNAAKYSPDQEKIIIDVFFDDHEIKVSVTDFGIGIPKDKQEKIFERFYQVESSTHSFKGLGLGLYIAAEIIKEHSGKIWVESEEGKGSKFYFSLPIKQVSSIEN